MSNSHKVRGGIHFWEIIRSSSTFSSWYFLTLKVIATFPLLGHLDWKNMHKSAEQARALYDVTWMVLEWWVGTMQDLPLFSSVALSPASSYAISTKEIYSCVGRAVIYWSHLINYNRGENLCAPPPHIFIRSIQQFFFRRLKIITMK